MRTITLVSFVAIAACTPQQGPFYISAVRSMDPGTCAVPMMGTGAQVAGFFTVDVRADPALWVLAEIGGNDDFASPTGQPSLTVGTRTLAAASREHGVVQKVLLRYASKPPIPGITANTVDTEALTGVLGTKTQLTVPLFGNILRSKLRDLVPSNDDTYDFNVSFEVHGILDQSGVAWHTPAYTLNMTLVNSEVNCAPPFDNRFKRFTDPRLFCASVGVTRRVLTSDCCELTPDQTNGTPGCDKRL